MISPGQVQMGDLQTLPIDGGTAGAHLDRNGFEE